MVDQKNHLSISSFRPKRLITSFLIFILPVIIFYAGLEYSLYKYGNFPEKIKINYFKKYHKEIKIIALGASHTQRAINPSLMDVRTLNLANSSQGPYENYILFKNFINDLPNLKLLIIGLTYNTLAIDKDFTQPVLDALNLKFYKVNTFKREVNYSDYLLFHTKPSYFSHKFFEILQNTNQEEFNKYGFETNKFSGNYKWYPEHPELLKDKDIYVYNEYDARTYKLNTQYISKIIQLCKTKNIQVLFYDPPTHKRYNQLRDSNLIHKRDSILKDFKAEYENVNFFIRDTAVGYTAKDFYNADHLNPIGAEKATKELNSYINSHYDLN